MIVLEALNALYGDCLILRYTDENDEDVIWLIDGGPRSETVGSQKIAVWRDVLLPRLKQISPLRPVPIALGMVSHIDDDHINGMQRLTSKLTAAGPANPAEVKFSSFWFNSCEQMLVVPPELKTKTAEVAVQSLPAIVMPHLDDHDAEAVVASINQGISLATDLRALKLQGNPPFGGLICAYKGQMPIPIRGADVTVLGPRKDRLEALQKAWSKALEEKSQEAKEAAIASLFLPERSLDKSVPNLSSIVLLVDIRGKRILLTGDAQGKDIVEAWDELGLGAGTVKLDILKVPHHGSNRNNPEAFLRKFVADHYVVSADGKHDNPDPEVVEAIVKLNGHREFALHFSNENVRWSKQYKTESGVTVSDLRALIEQLQKDCTNKWEAKFRPTDCFSEIVSLEP